MVYNIAEIKYTSCYPVICNLVPKRQMLCTQAMAIKSKFLKISKIAFLFIFYLSLWTKYLFRQNFAEEKIFASTKYRQRKNIGITKILVSTKYRCRQNIGEEKLLTSQKYWFRQNIDKGGACQPFHIRGGGLCCLKKLMEGENTRQVIL